MIVQPRFVYGEMLTGNAPYMVFLNIHGRNRSQDALILSIDEYTLREMSIRSSSQSPYPSSAEATASFMQSSLRYSLFNIPWGQSNEGAGVGGLMAIVGPWLAADRLVEGFLLLAFTSAAWVLLAMVTLLKSTWQAPACWSIRCLSSISSFQHLPCFSWAGTSGRTHFWPTLGRLELRLGAAVVSMVKLVPAWCGSNIPGLDRGMNVEVDPRVVNEPKRRLCASLL
jgi:hypothetical protein